MKRVAPALAIATLLATVIGSARASDVVLVGAVYPSGGGQGQGGIDEYRGVQLAAEYVNARARRHVRLVHARADSSDQAREAVARVAARGVPVILGSYGSTVSLPAADEAQRRGSVFWETGAVGEFGMAAMRGDRVFRFAPTGATLGTTAVRFARSVLLPALRREPSSLRYGVTFVDDVYGRAVAAGALAAIADAGLTSAGTFPYDLEGADFAELVARMRRARVDVLFVAAYLEDGIALRRETLRQRLPLVASVGTSSSYCMHEFGEALGTDAVGLFASDKPDGHVLDAGRLAPEAADAFRWARATFRARFDHEMTAPALTGFAGAWALFRHVLPHARTLTPDAIADAARRIDVPLGALPNGSGLAFAPRGSADPTSNVRATSVIWEWVAPRTRAVVWPPAFATSPLVPLEI